MGQDLRELFKEEQKQKFSLKQGHEDRFLQKLNDAMPIKKKGLNTIWYAAASIIVLIGIGFLGFLQLKMDTKVPTTIVDIDAIPQNEDFSFGDLSPDLKKVENYYVANINLELSKLEISKENKNLVDSFMDRLAELNMEYMDLNKELNELGPNDQTISALIENLQLRLQLLQKLKKKLNQLKSSKNEQITQNSI
ncbi:hypothetical protein ACOCEA_15405 [Maribacter sp. CXY002]|uniref:hypothetical protein n=1 Tax=Maribacter luteocoastalis TaxID=3407671 RepID=UPI003B6725E8